MKNYYLDVTVLILLSLILLFFVIIAYDWRTGNGKDTFLPNGHCIPFQQYSYNTLHISDGIITVNKFVQITMFLIYLVYFYRLKIAFRDAPNSVQ